MKKRICPCCGHNKFFADAYVRQLWQVTEHGVRLAIVDNFAEVSIGPEEDKNWLCAECNTPAVEEMGREELLDMMESIVEYLEENGSLGESYRALCEVKKRIKNVLRFSRGRA